MDAPPARYIMRLAVPDGFTATAAGVPTMNTRSGGVVWDTRIEVHFRTFAVADFDTYVIDWEVPVEMSIRNGGPNREQFERKLLENLPFLESLFGPFPFDRLGVSVMDRSGDSNVFRSQMAPQSRTRHTRAMSRYTS
jgi:hypothetical protein